MTALAAIEQRFWSQVWRCDHRWPCRRCCWPWKRWGTETDPWERWRSINRYGSFFDPLLRRSVSVHRYAYMLARGCLLLPAPTRPFCVRHVVCDFPPCCNAAHLAIGTHSDNMRDKRGKETLGYGRLITLPNGSRLSLAYPREG